MPGVLIVEALAQAAGVLIAASVPTRPGKLVADRLDRRRQAPPAGRPRRSAAAGGRQPNGSRTNAACRLRDGQGRRRPGRRGPAPVRDGRTPTDAAGSRGRGDAGRAWVRISTGRHAKSSAGGSGHFSVLILGPEEEPAIMATLIADTACVDPRAELADDVEVGPYCVIGPGGDDRPGHSPDRPCLHPRP